MEPLSEYNNNPGNLRPPKGVVYAGQIGVDDRGFAIFETKDAGRQALVGDIAAKMKKGLNTPEAFIDRYAPASDENPEDARDNYKIHLAQSLGLKSTGDSFPEDAAEKLADAIAQFEGGLPTQKPQEAAVEPTVAAEEVIPPSDRLESPGAAEAQRGAIGAIGANLGLGVAGALETGRRVSPLLPNIMRSVTGRDIAPNQPSSRMSLQRYLNSQIAPDLKLPLKELEKVTGAKKIRTMAEVYEALRQIQAVPEQKAAKPVYKAVAGRPGVFEQTGRVTTHVTPGRPGVDLTRYQLPPAGPVRQAARRTVTTAGEVARGVAPSMGRVGVGVLGGANMAMQGYDAWEMAKRLKEMNDPSWKDWARLASKGAAAVGGGLSMLPFAPAQGLGLALQAPEFIWSTAEGMNRGLPTTESAEDAAARRAQEQAAGYPMP
jgi:hypothetical protein